MYNIWAKSFFSEPFRYVVLAVIGDGSKTAEVFDYTNSAAGGWEESKFKQYIVRNSTVFSLFDNI